MSEHIQSLSGGRQPPESSHTQGTDAPRSEEHQRTPGVAHESEAFDFWLILWAGGVLAAVVLLVLVFNWWLLGGLEMPHAMPPVSELAKEDAERPLPERLDAVPAPHLEGVERDSRPSRIAAARQRAEEQMERYGWIDRQQEIVHVPIEKAIEQVLRSKEFGKPPGGKR
jgi:hypothetical protein